MGYGGFKYFITFIDDSHRFISIYFLKLRSEALKCFMDFRAAVEKFLGYSIVFLRIDNAPELVFGQFEEYCKREGITLLHLNGQFQTRPSKMVLPSEPTR